MQASVQIAPEKFTYYGLNGSYNNWKELGKWINDRLIPKAGIAISNH